jgi:predicted nucleotidyltransferase/uncharacterized protein (UPF0332 family)
LKKIKTSSSKKNNLEIRKIPAKRIRKKDIATLKIKTDHEIAMDFATKAYEKFNKIIKSIVLFGSTVKQTKTHGSDIDIILIIDDTSIKWDQELVAWYREELERVVRQNPYKKSLHINTIKLSTWWEDLMRGDPVVVNILRDGESLIDFGGFFEPLKYLLYAGKIKSTPEAIYSLLQRAPMHISRSKSAELGAIEGLFWSMVDSSQAAIIAAGISPPSPEHVPLHLKETFVDKGKLKIKYVIWYRDLLVLHKKIAHGNTTELKGVEIDEWQDRAKEFLKVMAELVDDIISK